MVERLIMEGDCLDILRDLPAEHVDAVITDPPYGIDFQSSRRTEDARLEKIANDERPFIWWVHDAARILKNDGAMLVFCRWDVQDAFKDAMELAGLVIRSQVIWDRQVHGMGDLKASFAPRHDVIWFATKGDGFAFPGDRPPSVISSMRVAAHLLEHPNEKPPELMRALVTAVTPPKGIVLDCFAGSGSTGVACRDTGRGFIGIEMNPKYVALGRKRIGGDGPLFAENQEPLL